VQQFGNSFKAKLIANHAGGWVYEQSAGNRRPFHVNKARKLQYGKRDYNVLTRPSAKLERPIFMEMPYKLNHIQADEARV